MDPVLFPPALESLPLASTLVETLRTRAAAHPELVWGLILFLCAILHTFLAPLISRMANVIMRRRPYLGRILELFSEVEFVFILWCIPLFFVLGGMTGFATSVGYLGTVVNYREPLFVMTVMALAATKPILILSERIIGVVAKALGGRVDSWWLSLLAVGPLLGSLITEPAAITITALLLAKKFFEYKPSLTLSYATLGLLFVNVSVGGVLTNFAAPPVVMVAQKWGLTTAYMFEHFGWHSLVGILVGTLVVRGVFMKEFRKLSEIGPVVARFEIIPPWITLTHIVLLAWAVGFSHYIPLFLFAFLGGIWFVHFTREYQDDWALLPALRVCLFLAGLVIFGGLQQWWIAPVLEQFSVPQLYLGATLLSSFNDNAAIAYLASLVPNFSEPMRFAVLAGAVTGGGLTVIANAPNPAGQGILKKYFPRHSVNPLKLLLAAIVPTLIIAWAFMNLPHLQ